jgi:hypothetical protein
MARIPGIAPAHAPFFIRVVLRRVRGIFGRDLTPSLIKARVPRVFWAAFFVDLAQQKSLLPQRLRSIANLRTASRIGCVF